MSTTGFPAELHETLRLLKEVTARVIESTCGSRARATDVASKLGLHTKLGWQVWHVAFSDEFDLHRFLPNAAGMKQFCEAAINKGAAPEQIQKLRDSVSKFYALAETHGSNREMFELILDAHSSHTNEDKDEKYRKQAFTGNAYTFGVYARAAISSGIIYPSEEAGHFGLVRINGLIDLVQNRIGIRWPVATLVVQEQDGAELALDRFPLFGQSPEANFAPLLDEFCSNPLPVVTRRMEGQSVVDELQAGVVGLTGARTIFTGEVIPCVGPITATVPDEEVFFGAGMRTPSELFVLDHLVHKSLFPQAERELRIFSELSSPTAHDERDRLHCNETLEYLGSGISSANTADVPGYRKLLDAAFAQINYDPNDFDLFRMRVAYPPIPASAMVCHKMNDPADFDYQSHKKEDE